MKALLHAAGIGTFVLIIALQFPACSIFTPVGDAVSAGYESTVTYFNAYYNAQRMFSEAEDEIRAAELATRGKESSGGTALAIPATAKSKLTTAIDKCSNILAFHPTSPLVDDALLMVGKSFFYMNDYLKAERKFLELQAQYAQSELIPEARFWYARCEERLNKLPQAIEACDSLISESRRSDDRPREVEAELLKAKVLSRLGDQDRAVEVLRQSLDRSPGDDFSVRIHTALGNLYAFNGRTEDAVKDYLVVPELTEDLYDSYYAKLQAAIGYRTLNQYDRSRAILKEMAGNFRYKEWYPSVTFELGKTHSAEGNIAEAVDAFRIVDTSNVRSDYSPRAAVELGRIFERVLLDYGEAKRYYGRASTFAVPKISDEAKRKSVALNRYFETSRKLFEQDSLWRAAHDSTARPAPPTPEEQKRLQAQRPPITEDEQETPRDTTRFRPPPPVVVAITNPDSLRRARMVWKQDLADVFYSELEVPDSAVYWYQASMLEGTDSLRTPRILFILGELARSNPDRGYVRAEERYKELIARYPGSEYARAARRSLGEASKEKTVDTGEVMYREAEALIDANKAQAAVEKLRQLATRYSSSPQAAKAEYAIAWLEEHRLQQPEKAVEQYRKVVAVHGLSRFAPLALRKVVMANARRDSIAADSIRRAAAEAAADTARKTVVVSPDSISRPGTRSPADTVRKSAILRPPVGILDSLKNSARSIKLDSAAIQRKKQVRDTLLQ